MNDNSDFEDYFEVDEVGIRLRPIAIMHYMDYFEDDEGGFL